MLRLTTIVVLFLLQGLPLFTAISTGTGGNVKAFAPEPAVVNSGSEPRMLDSNEDCKNLLDEYNTNPNKRPDIILRFSGALALFLKANKNHAYVGALQNAPDHRVYLRLVRCPASGDCTDDYLYAYEDEGISTKFTLTVGGEQTNNNKTCFYEAADFQRHNPTDSNLLDLRWALDVEGVDGFGGKVTTDEEGLSVQLKIPGGMYFTQVRSANSLFRIHKRIRQDLGPIALTVIGYIDLTDGSTAKLSLDGSATHWDYQPNEVWLIDVSQTRPQTRQEHGSHYYNDTVLLHQLVVSRKLPLEPWVRTGKRIRFEQDPSGNVASIAALPGFAKLPEGIKRALEHRCVQERPGEKELVRITASPTAACGLMRFGSSKPD